MPCLPAPFVVAQEMVALPAPGTRVHLSPAFAPPVLKGIKIHPDNPFRIEFVLSQGDAVFPEVDALNMELKRESTKLIKYFLAALTIPEKDLWVNLSPYEQDRIVPEFFGQTEMGRDLLTQDYMLKQITASLIYPEDEIGKQFWKRVYEEAGKEFGTTNIPVNTFNKMWIVPEQAVVYENAKSGSAYVVRSKLKVMLEADYLALNKNGSGAVPPKDVNSLASKIVREIVLPQLTKEVNEGRNFAMLRQIFHSLILATWYKKKIKESVLTQVYSDQQKIAGVDTDDPSEKEQIYQGYLQSFKKGVYNYIKEEQDPFNHQSVSRKYFSGGMQMATPLTVTNDLAHEDRNPVFAGEKRFLVRSDLAMAAKAATSEKSERSDLQERIRRFSLEVESYGSGMMDPYSVLGRRYSLTRYQIVEILKEYGYERNHLIAVAAIQKQKKAEKRKQQRLKARALRIKEAVYAAVDRIEGFSEARRKNKYELMAQLFRKHIKKFRGGASAFFYKNGRVTGLDKTGSPYALMKFVFPQCFDDHNPKLLSLADFPVKIHFTKTMAKAVILDALDQIDGFAQARADGNVRVMKEKYLEHVRGFRRKVRGGFIEGDLAYFKQFPLVRRVMNKKRRYLTRRDSPLALLKFALPALVNDKNPDALKLADFRYLHLTKRKAVKLINDGLSTIRGFQLAKVKGDIKKMRELYIEHVIGYLEIIDGRVESGQQAFFFRFPAIKRLVFEKHAFLGNAHSIVALVKLAVPQLFDPKNQEALTVADLYHRKHSPVSRLRITIRSEFYKIWGFREAQKQGDARKMKELFFTHIKGYARRQKETVVGGTLAFFDQFPEARKLISPTAADSANQFACWVLAGLPFPELTDKKNPHALRLGDFDGQFIVYKFSEVRQAMLKALYTIKGFDSARHLAKVERMQSLYQRHVHNFESYSGVRGERAFFRQVPLLKKIIPLENSRLKGKIELKDLLMMVAPQVVTRMGDSAQMGGIDLQADKVNLELQNSGQTIQFKTDPAMLKQLQNAPGFVPVIIDVQPMTDLRLFLGLTDEKSSIKAAAS